MLFHSNDSWVVSFVTYRLLRSALVPFPIRPGREMELIGLGPMNLTGRTGLIEERTEKRKPHPWRKRAARDSVRLRALSSSS